MTRFVFALAAVALTACAAPAPNAPRQDTISCSDRPVNGLGGDNTGGSDVPLPVRSPNQITNPKLNPNPNQPCPGAPGVGAGKDTTTSGLGSDQTGH